ncbi:TonB-dependent receptor domain-containing protein [Telmatospirillum sp.]|uniref:TonB-dependent receptor n=1 Tax=Telmatospirillum sp. TaxID=2079197 RepID=UPI00283EB9DF|nr:TonB-dependent receptor [Telmatospirillum sp.]MDR3438337.1 TonB-dependent receptor [Telmatospirillum sp.]
MNRKKIFLGVSAFSLVAATAMTSQAQTATQVATASDNVDTIVISTQGERRQVQSIDQQTLLDAAPGTSPIKAISELPGVSYTSADSFGAYEWATRISVRGFNQNQLGFTLDDVPLGDMSYGNWNGLHISRAIINENIAKSVISQGTGSLGIAANGNLGGSLEFVSMDPPDKLGGTIAQSFGSDAAYRTYARLDSGLLPTNTKFSVSVVNQDSDKWKGVGGQKDLQVNSKLVQNIGEGTVSAFLNYSDRAEVDYQDVSKEYVSKLGYRWDNYGDWTQSIKAANSIYSKGENNTSDALDAAYYGGAGLRKDWLGGVTVKTPINDVLSVKSTVYGHQDQGRGLWFTPYSPSPSGSPISLRTSEYTQGRVGTVSSLTYDTGRNSLTGGVWLERESFDLARRLYGTTLSSPVFSLYDFPSNPYATVWKFNFDTTVTQGYVEDSYRLTDALTLSAGFKATQTSIHGKLVQGSGYASGDIDASSPFLPQLGLSWKVTEHDEVFADVAKNMRSFQAGGPGYGAAPYQMTQAQFDASKDSLHPETSWTEEVGYRMQRGPINTSLSAYHVNFADRLLGISQCSGIVGCANALANVGGVTSNGVEAAATWHVLPGVTWYNGASFDKSTYDDDVVTGGTRYHVSGKNVVDTPEFMYKTDIGYQNDGFFAHLTGDYMGKRFYTYTNDNSVAGRMLWDVSTGYVIDQLGALKDVKVQFNVTNLFDKKYYSSIGTNGFAMTDPNGTLQTLQVGAPRAFFGTISTSF